GWPPESRARLCSSSSLQWATGVRRRCDTPMGSCVSSCSLPLPMPDCAGASTRQPAPRQLDEARLDGRFGPTIGRGDGPADPVATATSLWVVHHLTAGILASQP